MNELHGIINVSRSSKVIQKSPDVSDLGQTRMTEAECWAIRYNALTYSDDKFRVKIDFITPQNIFIMQLLLVL